MTIHILTRHRDGRTDLVDWLSGDIAAALAWALDHADESGRRHDPDHPDRTPRTIEIHDRHHCLIAIAITPGGLMPNPDT